MSDTLVRRILKGDRPGVRGKSAKIRAKLEQLAITATSVEAAS